MSRRKKPGAYTAEDAAMLAALFDPFTRDHALSLIAEAHDPAPDGHRAGLATAIERELLSHLERFIEKLYESGRGVSASEFDAAISLKSTAENLAQLLRLYDADGLLDKRTAREYSADLSTAWTRFIADASAYRMYGDLVGSLSCQKRIGAIANRRRAQRADRELLAEFIAWQKSARSQLQTLPAQERVRRFKIAKRPLADRKTRRLNALLREGRIPALEK